MKTIYAYKLLVKNTVQSKRAKGVQGLNIACEAGFGAGVCLTVGNPADWNIAVEYLRDATIAKIVIIVKVKKTIKQMNNIMRGGAK